MSRAIYGTAAGAVVAATVVSAVLLLGIRPGIESPAAQAQNPPARSPLRSGDSPAADSAVQTIRPTVENLFRQTTQPAHVESYESTDVYAKVSGFLKNMERDIGDTVAKGELLAELWIPEMEQELVQKAALVEQARSMVEQAQAQFATAEAMVAAAEAELAQSRAAMARQQAELAYRHSEHRRISELVQSRSVNEAIRDEKLKQLQSAEAALAEAHARVQSAEARVQVERARQQEVRANVSLARSQLKVAEADLEQSRILVQYAQVRAPYDGLITRRWADSGDLVASAANGTAVPLFTVDRIDKLRLVFDVPEAESALIRVGQPTSLVVDALKNRSFTGRIMRTAGVLHPKTRTLRVEAELDASAASLRPGMYGMITVTLIDRPQALVLPTGCIHFDGPIAYVFCLVNGVAEKRQVEVGYSDNTRSEIIRGVGAADVVLVDVHPAVEKAGGMQASSLRPR